MTQKTHPDRGGAPATALPAISRSALEALEPRTLLAAVDSGFYAPAQTQGTTPLSLVPIESVTPGQVTRVSFGAPFPRGYLNSADVSKVRILRTSNGTEVAARVSALTPWRDLSTLTDSNSVRSALVQMDVAFPDADGDGDADPLSLTLEWGQTVSPLADPAATPVRSSWVLVNDASYPGSHGVYEPNAYGVFTPEWYDRSMLKSRLKTSDTAVEFAGVGGSAGYDYDAWFAGFAGTSVNDDPRVSAGNRINYLTDYEPWLYDRAMTLYQLAFRTGQFKWLREAHRASQFYANHIDASGNFDLKGADIKYVYGENISTDYWLTGDDRLPAVHQRMIQVFDDFDADYQVGDFWTERNAGYKLLGYVTGYELLGTASIGQKAKDTFSVLVRMQNSPPAGAPNNGMLMHRSVDHGEGGTEWIASPWMSTLLIDAVERYYAQGGDTRVESFVTRMADGISQMGSALYSGDFEGQTLVMPYYLAGPNLTAGQHDQNEYADVEHALDVSKIFALAYYFSARDGTPTPLYATRFGELSRTTQAAFQYWYRPSGPSSGLAVYRMAPPRKFGWWFRTTANMDWLFDPTDAAPPPPDTTAPNASANAPDVTVAGANSYAFSVTFSDDRALNVGTLGTGDILVTGPGGFNQVATFVSVDNNTNGSPRVATYSVIPPGGTWDPSDNGTYQLVLQANQVADTAGNFAAPANLDTFTVAAVIDTTPPAISSVSSNNVSSSGATISWTTNEPSDSQVEYGTTTAYGSLTPLNPAQVTSHSVTLSGLQPNTTYHYRVLSRDGSGNLATSSNFTFTTPSTLVAYFSFDEGTGSTVNGGGSLNGTIAGASWAAGRYGNALRFDGVDDMVNVAHQASLDLRNAFTLEAWVNPTDTRVWSTILMKQRSSNLQYAVWGGDNSSRAAASVWTSNVTKLQGNTLPVNTWIHVAATYDGTNLRFYENGNLVSSLVIAGPLAASSGPLTFGGNNVWGEYFSGLIDEVRIHSVARTQQEIQQDMAAGAPPSSIQLNGTSAADQFYIRLSPSQDQFQVWQNATPGSGGPTQAVPMASLTSLNISALGGNDTITIDLSNGNPLPNTVSFNGGGGTADVLRIVGTSASDQFSIGNGQVIIGGRTVSYTGIESISLEMNGGDDTVRVLSALPSWPTMLWGSGSNTLDLAAGTHQFGTDLGGGSTSALSLVVRSGTTVNLSASQHLAGLRIEGSGRVNVSAGGNAPLVLGSLAIDAQSVLDLNDNDMILRAGTSADARALMANVESWIRTGRNGGAWNGLGIVSTSARQDVSGLTGLGVIHNSDPRGNPRYTTFAGTQVDANTVIVRYTWNGDANASGTVNADDYYLIDVGFLRRSPEFQYGDFDFDNDVDLDDYSILDSVFLSQNGSGVLLP